MYIKHNERMRVLGAIQLNIKIEEGVSCSRMNNAVENPVQNVPEIPLN